MSREYPRTLALYFPLWGLNFDSEGAGAVGRVMCCEPHWEEWLTLQKSDVWHASRQASAAPAEIPKAPCCLVCFAPLGELTSIEAAIETHGPRLLATTRDAVTVLRLYRSGWFLQPEQAMYVYYAPSLSGSLRRAPGPYRQAFVAGVRDLKLSPYQLRIADLTQARDTPGPITATWLLLEDFRASGGNNSVEIAIEAFNRSYGYQLRAVSRAANLFTALDALLGGMSARRIGKVAINPRGFARRVEVALSLGDPSSAANPRVEARWLNSEGRELRNAIAHGNGRAAEADAAASYERLQAIVRALLRQYIGFATRWNADRESVAESVGVPPASSLAATYVSALESEARQPGSARDILQ